MKNEFTEKLVDLYKKMISLIQENPEELIRSLHKDSGFHINIQRIDNNNIRIFVFLNEIGPVQVFLTITQLGEFKDPEISVEIIDDPVSSTYILPYDEDGILESYKQIILEKIEEDFNKFFGGMKRYEIMNNPLLMADIPEDIQSILSEMNMTVCTAMPELLKWHKRYKYLHAMIESIRESDIKIMNGTVFLIRRRLSNVKDIWNIYYNILDEVSYSDNELRRDLVKLKHELVDLNNKL